MNFLSTQVGDRLAAIATGREGTVTRVIDRDGAIGGVVEVRWDGERRPRSGAGFYGGNELRPVAVAASPECAGCALCDPAIAAYEAEVDAAYWAAEVAAS